jgi:DNA-directed RNA polymerase specialized sigma24 family protein
MAMLPGEKWDELIYSSNLGREGSRIADLYFIQQIPQIDIAEEIGLDRKTVSKRITTARAKIEHNYERLFKS